MRRVAAISVVGLALTGCVTLPPLNDAATLTVRSYHPTTGEYVLELRNNSSRPLLYLNPYLTFHVVRSPESEAFPEPPDGMALMIHDTKLPAGESVTFSGKCTSAGICSRPNTYVAVRACWYTKDWTCKEYLPVWSDTPLNGA